MRYAVRLLRKSVACTLTTILTLALCIGVNTAIFSVVDALPLRPLPYPEAERLAMVAIHYQSDGSDRTSLADRMWETVRDHAAYLGNAASIGALAAGTSPRRGKPNTPGNNKSEQAFSE